MNQLARFDIIPFLVMIFHFLTCGWTTWFTEPPNDSHDTPSLCSTYKIRMIGQVSFKSPCYKFQKLDLNMSLLYQDLLSPRKSFFMWWFRDRHMVPSSLLSISMMYNMMVMLWCRYLNFSKFDFLTCQFAKDHMSTWALSTDYFQLKLCPHS